MLVLRHAYARASTYSEWVASGPSGPGTRGALRLRSLLHHGLLMRLRLLLHLCCLHCRPSDGA